MANFFKNKRKINNAKSIISDYHALLSTSSIWEERVHITEYADAVELYRRCIGFMRAENIDTEPYIEMLEIIDKAENNTFSGDYDKADRDMKKNLREITDRIAIHTLLSIDD